MKGNHPIVAKVETLLRDEIPDLSVLEEELMPFLMSRQISFVHIFDPRDELEHIPTVSSIPREIEPGTEEYERMSKNRRKKLENIEHNLRLFKKIERFDTFAVLRRKEDTEINLSIRKLSCEDFWAKIGDIPLYAPIPENLAPYFVRKNGPGTQFR